MSDLPDLLDIDEDAKEEQEIEREDEHESLNVADGDDEAAEPENCRCLLCPRELPSALATFAHCRDEHAFDFLQLRKTHRTCPYQCACGGDDVGFVFACLVL